MAANKGKAKANTAAAIEPVIKGKGETVKGADGAPLVELGPIETLAFRDVKAGVNVCRPDGHTAAHIAALAMAMPTPAHQREPVWIGADGVLVAGFGRHAVAEMNKWPTILVRRILNDSPATRVLANLCENERSDERIGVMGRAAAYAALQRDGMSIRAIAAATGNAKSTDVVVDVCRIGDESKTHPLTRAALDAHVRGVTGIVSVKWTEAGAKGEKAKSGDVQPLPFGAIRHVSKAEWADQPSILRAVAGLSSDGVRVYVSAYRDALKAGKSADEARKAANDAARPRKGGDADADGEERETTGEGGNATTAGDDALRQHIAALTVANALKAHNLAGRIQRMANEADGKGEEIDPDALLRAVQPVIAALAATLDGLRKACGDAAYDAAKGEAVADAGEAAKAKAATKARR